MIGETGRTRRTPNVISLVPMTADVVTTRGPGAAGALFIVPRVPGDLQVGEADTDVCQRIR
ncbi:hypothetical protein YT1_p10085 (plasmid) [Rhodococcus ruber]|nr:hypothetical protein YT1_p10085 [Rhodococcus ruber]